MTQPEGPADTPEFWMGQALGEALAGSRVAAEAAGDGLRAFEEVAGLVERMAAAVTRGHAVVTRCRQAADHARGAVAGGWEQWDKIKPRLAHLRALIRGAAVAGIALLPLPRPEEGGRDSRPPETPEGVERAARDLPPPDRYRALARAATMRGDRAAAQWFEWRAAQPQAKGGGQGM